MEILLVLCRVFLPNYYELAAKVKPLMSFIQKAFRNLHPIAQLALIICASGTSMLFGVLAMMILVGQDPLLMNSIGLAFGGAAGGIIYTYLLSDGRGVGINSENKSKNLLLFLLGSVAIALIFSPIMDLSYRLNKWLLVEGSSIYNFAKNIEDLAFVETKNLLNLDSPTAFVMTLIGVALVPAIFEEYLFRGAIQPLMAKWTGNIHAGIWMSAFIFSFIHFQFFGLLPRMLLGAMFGYLLIWSGSIYTSMIAHFANNATVVAAAYILGPEWIDDNLDPSSTQIESVDYLMTLGTTIAIAAIIYLMNRGSVWPKNKAIYLMRGQ